MRMIYNTICNTEQPIVFVHGLAEDYSIFNRQVAFLKEKGFVTFAYDLAGHGNNPLREGKPTVTGLALDLEKILDAEDIETANLVGFSMGGTISLEFAYRNPKRVEKLCLINPALYRDDFITWKVAMLKPFLEVLKYFGRWDKKQRVNDIDLSKAPFSTAYYSFPYGLRKINLQSLDANIGAFIEHGVPGYLSEIETKTLIICGKDDELLKRKLPLFLQDELPNSDLVEVKGNHVLMLSNTEEVNGILLDYFRR